VWGAVVLAVLVAVQGLEEVVGWMQLFLLVMVVGTVKTESLHNKRLQEVLVVMLLTLQLSQMAVVAEGVPGVEVHCHSLHHLLYPPGHLVQQQLQQMMLLLPLLMLSPWPASPAASPACWTPCPCCLPYL
jgi:hypothetical protein